VVDSFGALLIL